MKKVREQTEPRPKSRVIITVYEELPWAARQMPCPRHRPEAGRGRVRYPNQTQGPGCDRRASLLAYSQHLRELGSQPEEMAKHKKRSRTKWRRNACGLRFAAWIRQLWCPATGRGRGFRRSVQEHGVECRCCPSTEAPRTTVHDGSCSSFAHCASFTFASRLPRLRLLQRRLKRVLGQLPCIWKHQEKG